MTEETLNIDAPKEVFVFVPLFKNVYESKGKKLVSYKPGYVPKGESTDVVKTFPVGLGDYDTEQDWDFIKEVYHRKFWTSVAVNESDEWDLVVTLNDVDQKDFYQKIYLNKNVRDWKVSFGADKPVEVAGKRYRVNLTKNIKEDKPQEMNLIFKEAGESGGWFGSEKEIDFFGNDLDI